MARPLLALFLFALSTGTAAEPRYDALIRRTSYGIPHIQAKDYGSLGFGEGYAYAEDHLCTTADQVIKARGERARYFGAGPGDAHLRNDIAMRGLDMAGRGAQFVAKQPADLRAMFEGFAAGYNAYLAKTGADKVGGWCRGAPWVRSITADDLGAAMQLVLLLPTTGMAPMIATAEPPRSGATSAGEALDWEMPELASNGWAVGKDISAGGRGMLLANPHYPWVGSNRFWEKHLEIPGELNVYGVGLLGLPGVAIGFNRDVAWTHTVSAGKRFTLYTLDLVPGKPTTYKYGNEERTMTPRKVSVEVKQADGALRTVERTVWFSHYGPILNYPGLGWTEKRTLTLRDANSDNTTASSQWMAMGRAKSLKELQAAHAKYQGMPWVNTIATGKEGIAWYADSASTPNLSAEALSAWTARRKSDFVASAAWQSGAVLLDGSDPRFEWQIDPGARAPGLIAFAHMPQVERTDFAFNSNDSFWLANPKSPLAGAYSPMHGPQGEAVSLRTRNNALTLSLGSPDKPAGADGKFTLDELGNAILSNRSLAAELLKSELVSRCEKQSSVIVDGETVDLTEACRVLGQWNDRFDLESRGAALFREWLGQFPNADFFKKGLLFATDFDPKDPVATPRDLAGGGVALENLGKAVRLLRSQKLALDVPLGQLQYADKAGRRMPVHGGQGLVDGVMNMQISSRNTTTLEPVDTPAPVKGSRFLTEKGYPVMHGSSFVLALEFTASGPRAKAFLTYSESGDPASPHYTDQTELFARKQWRPVLFEQRQVAADTKREYRVGNGGRP